MKKPSLELGGGNWGTRDGALIGFTQGDDVENIVPRQFTFERGDDIAVTRVKKDGLIEKGRQNFLKDSNGFNRQNNSSDDDGWVKNSGISVIQGFEGYDGSRDAWKLDSSKVTQSGTSVYAVTKQNITGASGVLTFSFYAKAGNVDWLRVNIYKSGGSFSNNYYDIKNGVAGANPSSTLELESIEAVGDKGWYRIAVTVDQEVANVRIQVADGDGSQYPPQGSFIYIQDAQLERGTAASSYIETGSPRNLFSNSNDLSHSDWAKNDITVEGNQLGYDGTHNAWKFTKTAAQYKQISQTIHGNNPIRTISVYAKAGSLDHVSLFHRDNDQDPAPDSGKKFDLVNGVVEAAGSAGSAISASMKDVGNGWYRCQMTYRHTGGNVVRIYADFSESDAGYIYIQNPQLENGSEATEYSGTSSYAGLRENTPRIDYMEDDGQLLLEPSRTNYMQYSEYMVSPLQLIDNPVITHNYAISPDGTKNAFRLQDTGGSNYRRIAENVSMGSDDTWNFSVFVKKADADVSTYGGMALNFYGGTQKLLYVLFNEYDGTMVRNSQSTVLAADATLTSEDYGDYWRFIIKATDQNSNTTVQSILYARLSNSWGSNANAGAKDYTAYGLQLEKGPCHTSYIPNHGASGGVTRSSEGEQDNDLKVELPSTLQTGYTVFVDFEVEANETGLNDYNDILTFMKDPAISKDAIRIENTLDGDGESHIRAFVYAEDSTNAFASLQDDKIAYGSRHKFAITVDDSYGIKMFVNGVKERDAAGVKTYEKVNYIQGASASQTRSVTRFNKIETYPEVLTEAECVTLTTI